MPSLLMVESPTLIILAEATTGPIETLSLSHMLEPIDESSRRIAPLTNTIRKALDSGLQVRLVAPLNLARQASDLLHTDHIIALAGDKPDINRLGNDQLTLGIAMAVSSSVQANGWLILPSDMPLLQRSTMQAMRQAMREHPIVYPEYRHTRGHPIGFSAEFYSELVRLHSERDLQRLLAQYPAHGVNVNDVGILMAQDAGHGMSLLRTVLQGDVRSVTPRCPWH